MLNKKSSLIIESLNINEDTANNKNEKIILQITDILNKAVDNEVLLNEVLQDVTKKVKKYLESKPSYEIDVFGKKFALNKDRRVIEFDLNSMKKAIVDGIKNSSFIKKVLSTTLPENISKQMFQDYKKYKKVKDLFSVNGNKVEVEELVFGSYQVELHIQFCNTPTLTTAHKNDGNFNYGVWEYKDFKDFMNEVIKQNIKKMCPDLIPFIKNYNTGVSGVSSNKGNVSQCLQVTFIIPYYDDNYYR